jgi:chemotaxis signal transduction protein
MTDIQSSLIDRAAALRAAFDRGFAEPAQIDTNPTEDFLAIRLGSEPHVLRLAEISGLFADKKITRVPGRVAARLGIAGFRGAIVPVYDLAALLGHRMSEAPRWLTLAAGAPVAFAIASFEGHLRIPRDAILPQGAGDQARNYVREFLRANDVVCSVIHLPAILDTIGRQGQVAKPKEER